jgi:hypothetical protein
LLFISFSLLPVFFWFAVGGIEGVGICCGLLFVCLSKQATYLQARQKSTILKTQKQARKALQSRGKAINIKTAKIE